MLLRNLLIENSCGPVFVKLALQYGHLFDGDIDRFIETVEALEIERENLEYGMLAIDCGPNSKNTDRSGENGKFTSGQMRVEYDYSGNCLEYYGYK